LLLEQAGIMLLAAREGSAGRPPWKQVLRAALSTSLRVGRKGAVQAALIALALVPFVLLAALTYGVFLSEYDVYYYLNVRPPAFWLAAGVGGLLLLGALAVAASLLVRWAFALPALLFEGLSVRAALRASRDRTRGVRRRVGTALLGWLAGVLLLGFALEAGLRVAAGHFLDGGAGLVALALLLLAHAALLAALSFALAVGPALLARRLYLWRSAQLGLSLGGGREAAAPAERAASPRLRVGAVLALAFALLSPLALWFGPLRRLTDHPPVRVTAHRGHARAAPENTLAAMRRAVESGADYAEMDVQLTADGVAVLLHDRDLKRVAGVSRRLDELRYDEVRRLDVGSWFSPAFAGERVPTLAEVIDLCRGKIRLNIELKVFGTDRRLAREVARVLREKEFESECLVTSLRYEALLDARRANDRLRAGLTVAYALGDVSRVEVEALSVRADFLSDELLRSARRHGKEVHVWTVNDPRQMTRQMARGVDNVITSDPDLGVRIRDEWEGRTPAERLVLASRVLLGLDP
jgi:glycerophosphoryl diester phosphodiesterase